MYQIPHYSQVQLFACQEYCTLNLYLLDNDVCNKRMITSNYISTTICTKFHFQFFNQSQFSFAESIWVTINGAIYVQLVLNLDLTVLHLSVQSIFIFLSQFQLLKILLGNFLNISLKSNVNSHQISLLKIFFKI